MAIFIRGKFTIMRSATAWQKLRGNRAKHGIKFHVLQGRALSFCHAWQCLWRRKKIFIKISQTTATRPAYARDKH
jgi:hypothetical protein